MSERHVSKVEQLLKMISPPRSGSESQLQAVKEDHPNTVTHEENQFCADAPDKADKEVIGSMRQSAEWETGMVNQDTSACHEVLTDTVTDNNIADSDNRTADEVNDSAMEYEVQISPLEAISKALDHKTKQDTGKSSIEHGADNLQPVISVCESITYYETQTQDIESTSVIAIGEASSGTISSDSSLQTNQLGMETTLKHVANAEINNSLTQDDMKHKLQEFKELSETDFNMDLNLSQTTVVDAKKEMGQMHDTELELLVPVNLVIKEQDTEEKTDKDVSEPHTDCESTESKALSGAEIVKMDSSIHETGIGQDLCIQNQYQMNEDTGTSDTSYEEIQLELKSCKEELVSTKSQLARATRQLEKANSYNEDLRKQIESLSAEIHNYRHRTVRDMDIQVDKDELINYVAGEMVMPDWGTTVQSNNTTADTNTEETSNQTEVGEKVSIAESLKATAEAVVLQQSGFVYDENSGLYYDYNSGYYYDNEKCLYYEPNTGTYFYYNHETNEYQFHSQVDVTCYQWQHQSQAANSQHAGSGGTTHLDKNKQSEKYSGSNQHKIVSKEKLKKTERNRKKEKKKEKDKDEKIFMNRKERRKAMMEKIEEKRKKREKTEKKERRKHHSHKKRKKKEMEKEGKVENDKYVEDKMRKRKKKKRKHKREKEKVNDSDNKEVIDLDEDNNMQWESEKVEDETTNIDEESVLVIDENVTSPVDNVCDSQTVENETVVDFVQSSNVCDENLRSLDAQVGKTSHDNNPAQNEEHKDFENTVNECFTGTTAIPDKISKKMSESEIIGDTYQSELDDKINVAKVEDTTTIYGEKHVDTVLKNESVADSKIKAAKQDFEEATNMINPEIGRIEGNSLQICEENDDIGLETIGSKSDMLNDADTSNIAATESKEELEIIELEPYEVTKKTVGASGSADNSIMISSDNESEMESGELTDSESSKTQTDSFSSMSSDSSPDSSSADSDFAEWIEEEEDWSQRNELAGGWPPCIRVMVTESNCLSVGTLFIVTCTGGTIGREKEMNHTIRIPDISVSKMHAEFQFDSRQGQYKIIDRGSQNGTFINDYRIGETKEKSSASPVNHGDILQLGDTKLLCHIHTGSDTCDSCEPGIVIANHIAKQPQKKITILSKEEKKQQQKQQLKEIKKKYGLKNAAYVDNTVAINNPLYTDKASERRKTVGSDGPEIVRHEAPASVHRPISTENIGHKLLKKMGWSEGESLGKENTGIQEPVTVSLRANQTAGLGSSTGVYSPDDANSINVKKAARRVQAQQRFNKLQTEGTGNQTNKNKSQTDKQWTKGETQYAEGAGGGVG